MPAAVTTDRVDSLTGLRIVAATLVFVSHVSAPGFIATPLRTAMSAGYNGVTIFFVLSGFVIAWNYTDRLTPLSGRSLRSYAVARVARIYPLYACALLWVAAPALVARALPENALLHVFALQTWHPDVGVAFGLNGPGWSIGVEFFLYACFPLLILAIRPLRDRRSLLIALAVVAILVVGALAWWFTATGRGALTTGDPDSAHRWLYRTPLTRLGDFVVGICAALLARHSRVAPLGGAVAQAVAVGAFVLLMAWPALLNTAWSWDFAYLVPAGLLVWGLTAAPGTVLSRALSTRPMVLAGGASFAFYLFHAPLLGRLAIGPVDRWYGWVFTTALEFGMILLLAVGAHIVIEQPMQRWLRRLLDRSPRLGRRSGRPQSREDVGALTGVPAGATGV